jgi:hypothetical protein
VAAGHSQVPGLRLTNSNNLEDFLLKGAWVSSGRITQIGNPTRFTVHVRLDPKNVHFDLLLSFLSNALFNVIFRHQFQYSQERQDASSTLLASSIKCHFELMFII